MRDTFRGKVGQQKGQPAAYTHNRQPFNPENSAKFPAGVRQPTLTDYLHYRPLLQRTAQGWRTRGGRQLWED